MVRLKQNPATLYILMKVSLDSLPVTVAVFWSPGDDQTIIALSHQDTVKCGNQILKPLIGRNVSEEQHGLFAVADPQPASGLAGGELRVRNGVVDPERDHRNPAFFDLE